MLYRHDTVYHFLSVGIHVILLMSNKHLNEIPIDKKLSHLATFDASYLQ